MVRVGVRVRVGLEVEGTLRHAPSPYGDAQARLVGGGVVVECRGGEAARVEVGAAGALQRCRGAVITRARLHAAIDDLVKGSGSV